MFPAGREITKMNQLGPKGGRRGKVTLAVLYKFVDDEDILVMPLLAVYYLHSSG